MSEHNMYEAQMLLQQQQQHLQQQQLLQQQHQQFYAGQHNPAHHHHSPMQQQPYGGGMHHAAVGSPGMGVNAMAAAGVGQQLAGGMHHHAGIDNGSPMDYADQNGGPHYNMNMGTATILAHQKPGAELLSMGAGALAPNNNTVVMASSPHMLHHHPVPQQHHPPHQHNMSSSTSSSSSSSSSTTSGGSSSHSSTPLAPTAEYYDSPQPTLTPGGSIGGGMQTTPYNTSIGSVGSVGGGVGGGCAEDDTSSPLTDYERMNRPSPLSNNSASGMSPLDGNTACGSGGGVSSATYYGSGGGGMSSSSPYAYGNGTTPSPSSLPSPSQFPVVAVVGNHHAHAQQQQPPLPPQPPPLAASMLYGSGVAAYAAQQSSFSAGSHMAHVAGVAALSPVLPVITPLPATSTPPHRNSTGTGTRGGRGSRGGRGGSRGRPRKAAVPIYQSQISGDKNTIKIRIRKSSVGAQDHLLPTPPHKRKSGRRKKQRISDDEDASDDPDRPSGGGGGGAGRRSRGWGAQSSAAAQAAATAAAAAQASAARLAAEAEDDGREQSRWATDVPEKVLIKVFEYVTGVDGSLPVLVRLCRVCKLWQTVAVMPELWRKVDLIWVKERQRTDLKLHWLITTRLSHVTDLNLAEWKVRDIQVALEMLSGHCPEIRGLNLSGWNGLNADNLKFLTTECENLERLDLSSVNSASAMNAQPLVGLAQSMAERLTHLVLAHNKLAGFTQIIASIAAHCPNLELLDISNIRTYAHNSALLHVEKLQTGCPKLRILRLTNSQIWLAQASRGDQMASPGFAALEELSIAGIEDGKATTARCLDDDGIERILKNSRKLRLLDLRGCIRLTDSGLVRGVTAGDLEHLFLSGCNITRTQYSGLELILQKWSHSLREVDLTWSTATKSLDAAVLALSENASDSPLRILNLCGSSINLHPIKAVLAHCRRLQSINLQSCRALPRGIKRLYTGESVDELRATLLERSARAASAAGGDGSDVDDADGD